MAEITKSVGLFSLVYGESKVGKSWLGYTSPAPKLIIDAEGRTKFIPEERKVMWNPITERPPTFEAGGPNIIEGEDTPKTCVVICNDWQTLQAAYQWLVSGEHSFRSVVLDSLTELQKRYIDEVSGVDQSTQNQWGEVLRVVEDIVRKLRDLTLSTAKRQLDSYTIICLTDERNGKQWPLVRGSLAKVLPGHADLIGYFKAEPDLTTGEVIRSLCISPSMQYLAGDGTGILTAHYGPAIRNPNLAEMVGVLNQETA